MSFRGLKKIIFALTLPVLFYACAGLQMPGTHKSTLCDECHDVREGGETILKKTKALSKECNKCHGYQDEGSHHPLSLISGPFGNTAELDPVFKLYDGQLECISCHIIHYEDLKYGEYRIPLVGGPYEERREQCFRCHREQVYRGVNPHEMMLDGSKQLEKTTCLICHAEVPDPEVDRTEDVKFRASIGFLCWRCHPRMVGSFFDRHYLKSPNRKRLIEFKWAEKDNKVILPLDFKNRMTCSTCHNPHQKGVMVYENAKSGAGEVKKLRSGTEHRICNHCHKGM